MPRMILSDVTLADVMMKIADQDKRLLRIEDTLQSLLAAMGSVNCSQVQLAQEVRTARIEMDGTRQDLSDIADAQYDAEVPEMLRGPVEPAPG